MGKKSGDKKRKQPDAAPAAPAPAPAGGFSLFGGGAKADADLGGLFSASAAFALPDKKVKKAKKAREERVDEVVEEIEVEGAEVEGAEVEEAEVEEAAVSPAESAEENEEADSAEASDEDQETAPEADITIATAGPEEAESDAESELDLTHEALKPKKDKGKKKGAVYVPEGESAVERDRRTLFVGNVALEVAKSKSQQNQLRAHLLTFAPSAKIESMRFRSVAFSTPTVAVAAEGEDEKAATKRAKREQKRAAEWRATQDAEGSTTGGAGNRRGDDEVVDRSKSFLDAKGKRKVAFIKGEFHSDAASCNAYVVFAHPHPDRSANVAPILDPFEAADKVLAANGSTFMDRHIRVDRLRLPSAVGLASATNALGKRDAWLPTGTDPKKSLFVGGLDYAAKEEDVRAFFEALVTTERGARAEGGQYVTEVRIVRDKDTQLGKGFGYVHFAERESVDEMIALPSAKLKFAKKPLRVQPCKTLPAHVRIHGNKPDAAAGAAGKGGKGGAPGKKAVAAGPIPRGNPALGDKLKDLSKEERKAVKAVDAERQARRMAKKKNKVAAAHRETGAVKLAATKAERKRTDKKVAAKAKKGRVRSAHALSKMKGSRT